MTSWCWILRTVRENAFDDLTGFLLESAIKWSCSSLRTEAERHIVKWWPFTSIWIHLHPTAYCSWFLLVSALRMIFKFTSWVMCLVAALVALRWTNCCLHSCYAAMIAVFDVAPAYRLDLELLPPCWGGCVSMICLCEIGKEDGNEKKLEARRTI